jgi:hypothetical protein
MMFPGAGPGVRRILVGTILLGMAMTVSAQESAMGGNRVQREAMQKLSFLIGRWAGPVTIMRGPGEPLKLRQTENVQSKLDGLVLLIEGQSTAADGKAEFQALATVAFDEASHTYRIRAYNDGHSIDTELTVQGDGFSWGFNAGPAKIENTMHLTANGEWQETSDVSFGGNPPRRSVEMLLSRQK